MVCPTRETTSVPASDLRPFIIDNVWQLDDALVQRLYKRAAADRWQLPAAAFASFLQTSAQRAFGDEPPESNKLKRYFESLHLEDLALACACAEGNERAWDTFVVDYRPVLYRAADALDPSGGAREAADSLYGELFGLKSLGGERQSHLRYYHGRSSLATWLRAVLSQRYVDRRRAYARLEPLPVEDLSANRDASLARPSSVVSGFVEILSRVISVTVASLPPRDRLRLRCYYMQDMTLARIGKMLGESEATASRQLARTRGAIRKDVERALRDEQNMSEAEIAEGFAAVVEDSATLDLAKMLGPEPVRAEGRKKLTQDRSK